MANFIGTIGDDTQAGTNGDDSFDYSQGGKDVLKGRLGDDTFFMGAALRASDHIDGGQFYTDTVILDGDYNIVCGAKTLVDIEALRFTGGHDYTITTADTMAANSILPFDVDASSLGRDDVLEFHGQAEADVVFQVFCGAGDDIVATGGGEDHLYGGKGVDQLFSGDARDHEEGASGADTLDGGAGEDVLYGGKGGDTLIGNLDGDQLFGGAGGDGLYGGLGGDGLTGGAGHDVLSGGAEGDVFFYSTVADSTGRGCDWITDFDASSDVFASQAASPSAIDPMVTSGTLTDANFDSELTAAIGAVQLEAGHAVVFTPDMGNRAGAYLIIDANGIGGYQAGQDVVIELTGGVGLQNLTVGGNFV